MNTDKAKARIASIMAHDSATTIIRSHGKGPLAEAIALAHAEVNLEACRELGAEVHYSNAFSIYIALAALVAA